MSAHAQFSNARYPNSLWIDTAQALDASPQLVGSERADVVVIGAGFTGLRAALVLAEAGTKVIVVDACDVGGGASGRNGGQVNPMPTFSNPVALREAVGTQYFERIVELYLQSADELFDLIRQHNIESQARQCGWMRVDHCEEAKTVSRANAQAWNQFGAKLELVDDADVKRLTGSPRYASGVLSRSAGAIHPLSQARGLARAVLAAGGRIFGSSPVSDIKRDGEHWVVNTPNGQISTEWVVQCTNAYTRDLNKPLAKSIVPLAPIQIATQPLLPEQIEPVLPDGQTIADTRRVIMYSRREPDDRMVYGGLGHLDSRGNIAGFNELIKDAESVFPSLRGVQWTFRWGGQVAITADRVPHIHEPEPGLISGLGYNGRGVAMSHVMGRILAERVLGADAASLPFPVTAISPFPFHGFHTTGARVATGWMKLRDRIEFR